MEEKLKGIGNRNKGSDKCLIEFQKERLETVGTNNIEKCGIREFRN